jgi:hypothetical protein
MPSEPAILGQVHSSPNSLSNVSRGFDRNRAVFRLFVCVDAQNKSQRLEGPKEPCPWPTRSTRALHTQRVPRRPLVRQQNVALFLAPIGVRFFAGASAPLD